MFDLQNTISLQACFGCYRADYSRVSWMQEMNLSVAICHHFLLKLFSHDFGVLNNILQNDDPIINPIGLILIPYLLFQ